MKKILGLDLGTNSIGWAVMNAEVVTRDNDTRQSHYPDVRRYSWKF